MLYLRLFDLLAVAILALVIIKCLPKLVSVKRRNYPPGPKPLPLIANLLQFPQLSAWLTYDRWARDYGDVVHISAFGVHVVVLHSLEAITDLLEKRGSIYSGRPHLPMVGDLMGVAGTTALLDNGPTWKKHRRLFNQYYFNANAVGLYHDIQVSETQKMTEKLLDTPEDFREHIKHWMGAIILETTYGIRAQDEDDENVAVVNAAMDALNETLIPGKFLVDLVPVLKYVPTWFPGALFKVKARRWRKIILRAINDPFEMVKSTLRDASGTLPSFASLALRSLEEDESSHSTEEEVIIKCAAATTFAAGSETTSSALLAFIGAMVLYPGVQREAQTELKSVIGVGRFPTLSDRDSLPYVAAIVKELLRWQPVVPLAIPHKLTVDDEYRGYCIPKGAIVMGNAWSILHDEKNYPNPHEFRPERFLREGKLDQNVLDPGRGAFGFGPRVCPGRQFAMNGLFTAVAAILTCFDIRHAIDHSGKKVPINFAMSPGLTSTPEAFMCSITPRSDSAHAAALQRSSRKV